MLGAADILMLTFGYLASATAWSIPAGILFSVAMTAFTAMWSMISVSPAWRSAIGANFGSRPNAMNMTGSPAFSAAGQNQSAVPSDSQPIIVGVLKVTRTPSIPGCSFHFGKRVADWGFWSGMRPMTAKRSGYRLAASIA